MMLGGFIGSICRFYAGEWARGHLDARVPFGTLLINLLGCFFLGWLLTYASRKVQINERVVLFLGTGFTGSFTTFSAFSVETVILLDDGHFLWAAIYVLLSILLGLCFAIAGKALADSIFIRGGESE
ncbi:fluoride efflux transporter CrcB [Peribacillus glennii]|nr:fluoride efflux transporter CrcB [Peribacillus glennii]